MIVTVTTTVVFDVPGEPSVDEVRAKFYEAHRVMIGHPLETVTGQRYTLVAIEVFDVMRGRRQ